MMEALLSPEAMVVYGGLFVVIEYVLGKTDLVKSNSTLELVLRGLLRAKALLPKKSDAKGS